MSAENAEFASKDYTAGKLNAIVKLLKKQAGEDGPERFLRGELVVKMSDLLKQVATVAVNGSKKFVAKDHIKAANVVRMDGNFRKLFFDMVEENVEATTLNAYNLERALLDAQVLAELGERARIFLAHFFELLEKQSKGEAGLFLTNGYANIAYIIGSDGNLWAVYADWHGSGWDMHAYSVDRPFRWLVGSQVLAR